MSQKIAVAIIHGAGVQHPGFSKGMKEELQARFIGAFRPDRYGDMRGELVFREIHWADVLTEKSNELSKKLEASGKLGWRGLRAFMLDFYADTIAYQPGRNRQFVYDEIHAIFAGVLEQLAAEDAAGPEAPLCIIGHSLGTIISHNYLYDLQDTSRSSRSVDRRGLSDLEKGRTLALFITMGSPLALWSLRYSIRGDYSPIRFPGRKVGALFPNAQPKWINFYDKDDVVASPIGMLSPKHEELVAKGLLVDMQVDTGPPHTSWTPIAHTGYWTDNSVTVPLAEQLVQLWKSVNPGAGEQAS